MNREEKINSEWIKIIGEEKFATIELDNYGWLNFNTTQGYHSYNLKYNGFSSKNYDPFKRGEYSHVQNVSIRPTTLKGLEDNLGWTKIESIDDLPTDDKSYWCYDGEIIYINPLTKNEITERYKLNLITHYKPIVIIEETPVY